MCGKWKALTQRYARDPQNGSNAASSATDHIVSALLNVLVVSGLDARPESLKSTITAQYREKVAEIVSSSLALQRATGEEVISSDVQILCPLCDDNFRGDEMEDIDDSKRETATRKTYANVMCTTEIGLSRRERRVDTTSESSGDIVAAVMLKARVALISLAAELAPQHAANVLTSW